MVTTQFRSAVSSPPRWAVRAAHVPALLTIPTGIWRLLLVTGHRAGYTEAGFVALGVTGWGAARSTTLTAISEALALLTLGLVRPWGEVLPRWIPLLGGRRVRPLAAVIPAGLGAVALTFLWTPFALWWTLPHHDMTTLGRTVVGYLYLPSIAWGPLLGVITIEYHRRQRGASPNR